jgi:hypothetical protein
MFLFQICLNELETAIRIYEYLEKRVRPESHFELETDLEIDPGAAYLPVST